MMKPVTSRSHRTIAICVLNRCIRAVAVWIAVVPLVIAGQSVGHLEQWKSLVVAQVQLGDESARVVEGADVKFDQLPNYATTDLSGNFGRFPTQFYLQF